MKKITILIFSLLIANSIFGQEEEKKITNQISKKEFVIKVNNRIKIKTIDGKKISGRFKIENNSILINNEQFELSDIGEIKRNPLLVSILKSGILIYGGAITAGFGGLIRVLVDSFAFLLTIPAAAMIYTGIKSPNFSRKFKTDISWIFETIVIPE